MIFFSRTGWDWGFRIKKYSDVLLTFQTGGQAGGGRDHDGGVGVALGEEVPLPRLELGKVIPLLPRLLVGQVGKSLLRCDQQSRCVPTEVSGQDIIWRMLGSLSLSAANREFFILLSVAFNFPFLPFGINVTFKVLNALIVSSIYIFRWLSHIFETLSTIAWNCLWLPQNCHKIVSPFWQCW